MKKFETFCAFALLISLTTISESFSDQIRARKDDQVTSNQLSLNFGDFKANDFYRSPVTFRLELSEKIPAISQHYGSFKLVEKTDEPSRRYIYHYEKHSIPAQSAEESIDRAHYLKSTFTYDFTHSKIQPLVNEIKDRHLTQESEILQAVRSLVVSTLHKSLSHPKLLEEYSDLTASNVLNAKPPESGPCQLYSILFVALARANGLPARQISGIQLREGGGGLHEWVEVYTEDGKWTAFEPQTDERHLGEGEGCQIGFTEAPQKETAEEDPSEKRCLLTKDLPKMITVKRYL